MIELKPITPQIAMAIADSEIWERITSDGGNSENSELPEHGVYFAYVADGDVIGYIWFEHEQPECIKIHPAILKPYRKNFSEKCVKLFLNCVKTQFLEIEKVNAEIPVCYPSVCNFAEKMGFKLEGINRKSIRKGGKMIDQRLYRITREEL